MIVCLSLIPVIIKGGDRDFTFGVQVDRSKLQPIHDKSLLNGAWSRSRDPL